MVYSCPATGVAGGNDPMAGSNLIGGRRAWALVFAFDRRQYLRVRVTLALLAAGQLAGPRPARRQLPLASLLG